MNFYPPPPVIKASLFLQIPHSLRCTGKDTEWTGGFTRTFKHIFLEGPVVDKQGNLFVVDIPYGRILRVDTNDKSVVVAAAWDGEPNGLALRQDGTFVVADYKQVNSRRVTQLCVLSG
jgi:sugar lactone lactonase YvrE